MRLTSNDYYLQFGTLSIQLFVNCLHNLTTMKKSILLFILLSVSLLGFLNASPNWTTCPPPGGTVIIIQGYGNNQALIINEDAFAENQELVQVQVVDLNERIVFQSSLSELKNNSIKGLLPGQYKLRLVSNKNKTEQGFWINN